RGPVIPRTARGGVTPDGFAHAVVVFFFFQAEDGIRDFHVTGVQTCALPIYCVHLHDADIKRLAETGAGVAHCPSSNARLGAGIRSEERRVGKECRSRWGPYH